MAKAVGLGFGESYHFSCALRPSLSYFDHPPLSLWLGTLALRLGGVDGVALRLPFVLLFAGTTWLTFSLGRTLFTARAGWLAALVLNLSAVFTISVGMFLQSDGPLMFFWLACTACLVRIFFSPQLDRPMAWWMLTGATLGLALLSKYHAVFLVFGAGLFALVSKEQRRWIAHPGPYVAMAIAAAIFSPALIWNARYDWISFRWQGQRGLESQGLHWDWLARDIGGQALWLLPWIWWPLALELPRSMLLAVRDPVRRFLACMAVGPIVLFTAVSAYANVGFHFHWQAPGYLMLFLALGATLADRLARGHAVSIWWLRSSIAFTILAVLALGVHCSTGAWTRLGPRWLSDRVGESDDPTLECLDYTSLPSAFERLGIFQHDRTFVFTNRWFESGKVDFALAGRMPAACLSPDPRSWAFIAPPDGFLGWNGILVARKKFLDDASGWYGDYFEKIEPLGEVAIPRGGATAMTVELYRCTNFRKPYPQPYGPHASP